MAAPAILAPETRLKLRNILFATDFTEGSRLALPYAGSIARVFGSRVHLCHVEAPVPLSSGVAAPQIYEALGKDIADHLTELLNAPALKGSELKLALGEGEVRDEISRIVRDQNIDLIVAGTHGHTGVKHLLLGSVVEEICRTARCPVLTVGPGTPFRKNAPFTRILLPTTLTESSDKILPYVTLLATEYGAQVIVLHVILKNEIEVVSGQNGSLASTLQHAMERKMLPELAFFRPAFLVASGDPAEVVLRTALLQKVDLIAMGIKNVMPPGFQIRSSTAYRIIAGAHCPVLTLK